VVALESTESALPADRCQRNSIYIHQKRRNSLGGSVFWRC